MSDPEDVKANDPAPDPPAVDRPADLPAAKGAPAPSGRWPWLRSVAYSLMVFLSPAVWVIDTSSCTAEGAEVERTTRTGIELARGMGVAGVPDTVIFVGLLAIMLVAPWLAWRARTPLARLGFHVLGLLTALFGMMCAWFLVFFALFEIREVQPVGYLVLVLSFVPLIESFARVALGVIEVRAHRRAQPPRAGPAAGA